MISKANAPESLNKAELRRLLATRLNSNDISVVWFDTFGTQPERDLANVALDTQIIELIERVEQKQLKDRLFDSLRVRRPDLWPQGDQTLVDQTVLRQVYPSPSTPEIYGASHSVRPNTNIMAKVLVVDDKADKRNILVNRLLQHHHSPVPNAGAVKFLPDKEIQSFDVAIVDLRLSETDSNELGLDTVRHIRKVAPDIVIIMITSYGSNEGNWEAMEAGADYFIRREEASAMNLIDKMMSVGTARISAKNRAEETRKEAEEAKVRSEAVRIRSMQALRRIFVLYISVIFALLFISIIRFVNSRDYIYLGLFLFVIFFTAGVIEGVKTIRLGNMVEVKVGE